MNRRLLILVCLALTPGVGAAHAAGQSLHVGDRKLDAALLARAHQTSASARRLARSRVIVRGLDRRRTAALIDAAGGAAGQVFPSLGAQVALVPDAALHWLASHAEIAGISLDREVRDTMQRTARAIGAGYVVDSLGLDGSGVGVASIDSGVNAWHPDLDDRIIHFADFVSEQSAPYDDYGHGTHVAGIIAGNGQDSKGPRRGIAPGAHLLVLKALDSRGVGLTSNVIAAIEYAIEHRSAYNIRVINLSVAAGVYESYKTDPLTLAARRAVDAGIVVVAAAGNRGRSADGQAAYGGIASPGNAPWVLTVGASSERGTSAREDDEVAGFSSRGPSAIDNSAKPDIVAPGVAIESTTDPGSVLYAAAPPRLWRSARNGRDAYMSLTGTSMAAPVATGAIALMLQANPALTPNAVKAILQYTAESHVGVDHLTQGAGFLNARGAVELALAFADGATIESTSDPVRWSRHIFWGNRRIAGRLLDPMANAWDPHVTWGDATTVDGKAVEWGICAGTACATPDATATCEPGSIHCGPVGNDRRPEDEDDEGMRR
jgi:serine protease AprX